MNLLTRMEELLLLSVWKLQDEAYGLKIRRHLSEMLNKNLSVGAVYVPLKRLKKRGYLESRDSKPTPKRGGRSKRYFNLTSKGVRALKHVKTIEDKSWANLPDIELGWHPAKS